MNFIAIIPARFQSTRFPGKPLAMLGNKPIIQHVYEHARETLDHVWVATDDKRIAETVKEFGGQFVMTRPDHQSGTDRCAEAAQIIAKELQFDVIINIQGDEPFVQKEQVNSLKNCFLDETTEIATLIKKAEKEDLFNPNRPKVVIDKNRNALFFSRATIPYIRGAETEAWIKKHEFYCHLGMYAYRTGVLLQLTKLSPSSLELAESLEQLRWLENGFHIKTAVTKFESIGIDTPEDLGKARKML